MVPLLVCGDHREKYGRWYGFLVRVFRRHPVAGWY